MKIGIMGLGYLSLSLELDFGKYRRSTGFELSLIALSSIKLAEVVIAIENTQGNLTIALIDDGGNLII